MRRGIFELQRANPAVLVLSSKGRVIEREQVTINLRGAELPVGQDVRAEARASHGIPAQIVLRDSAQSTSYSFESPGLSGRPSLTRQSAVPIRISPGWTTPARPSRSLRRRPLRSTLGGGSATSSVPGATRLASGSRARSFSLRR